MTWNIFKWDYPSWAAVVLWLLLMAGAILAVLAAMSVVTNFWRSDMGWAIIPAAVGGLSVLISFAAMDERPRATLLIAWGGAGAAWAIAGIELGIQRLTFHQFLVAAGCVVTAVVVMALISGFFETRRMTVKRVKDKF